MAFQFNNLYDFNTESGVVIPDTSTLKSSVEQMMYAIFGADLDVTPETPVGRLVEAITMLMSQTLGVNAQNANQYNIYQASGAYLDSIGALYNLYRKGATSTRVKIKVTGTCQTVPQNSLIRSTDGNIFYVENDITLQSGEGEGYALSQETGPIPCDIGTLTQIMTSVIGWETVINDNASPTYGTNIETDTAYRNRIIAARATGSASVEAIANAIYGCDDGVSSCVVYENGFGQNIVKNGILIPPHCIYACVFGGTDAKVANAIFKTKTAGAGYTTSAGTATLKNITVTDSVSGATYHVYFFRPIEKTATWGISVSRSSYSGTDVIPSIKQALVDYTNEVGIGSTISIEGAAAFIAAKMPTLKVNSITLTIDSSSQAELKLEGNKIPVTTSNNITVTEV